MSLPYDMDKARYSSKTSEGHITTNWYSLPSYTFSHQTNESFQPRNWTQDRIQYVRRSPKVKVKPCLHEQLHASVINDSFSYADTTGSFYREIFVTGASAMAMDAYPDVAHMSVFVPTADLGLSLADEVAGRIKPGLLSMATLGELGSLRELSLSLSSWVGTLKRILGSARKGSTLTDFVSAHLGWKFGISPLLSDLYASVNVLDNVGKHLASLYRRNNLGWTQHSVAATGSSSEISGAMRSTSKTVRLTCEANGRFYVGAGDEIRTALSYFGLDKPFSSAWELVPFSFIIDYVIRVQDLAAYLDSKLSEPIYNANIQIRNIQISDKTVTTGIYKFGYLLASDLTVDVMKTTYQRQPLDSLNDIPLFLDGLAAHGMRLENAFTSGEVLLALTTGLMNGYKPKPGSIL